MRVISRGDSIRHLILYVSSILCDEINLAGWMPCASLRCCSAQPGYEKWNKMVENATM